MRSRELAERRYKGDFSLGCGVPPAGEHWADMAQPAAAGAPTRESAVGTLRSIETILGNLARAQSELLRAADAVPAEQWKTKPAEGRWSAGEVICHLSAVERAILSRADKLLQKPPNPAPFYKRFHIPMMFVEARVIRRKAPTPLEPQTVREKEEMLAELRQVRESTLAFIGETMERDLSKYCMAHTFLGTLNAYEWLQFIASHEVRHTKQMREIAGSLPKNVTRLQK